MKKQKIIVAIAAILFSSSLLFAGNPENLATKMVQKLNADITLTDNQKAIIQEKARVYAVKRETANSLTSKTDMSAGKKQALQQYKAALDSLLTKEQKTQLSTKQNERKAAIYKKNKTTK